MQMQLAMATMLPLQIRFMNLSKQIRILMLHLLSSWKYGHRNQCENYKSMKLHSEAYYLASGELCYSHI